MQNGGPDDVGDEKENAFALPREIVSDGSQGKMKQRFVTELSALRVERNSVVDTFEVNSGAIVPLPIRGAQLEIRAKLHAPPVTQSPSWSWSWGLAVFGSDRFERRTTVGYFHGDVASGVFVNRTITAESNEAWEADVRIGPIPSNDLEESLVVFIDGSMIEAIAAEETAVSVWAHPDEENDNFVRVFVINGSEDVSVQIDVEVYELAIK